MKQTCRTIGFLLLCAILPATMAGCMADSARSFHASLDESVRTSVRSLTIVPAGYQPENNIVAFAKSRTAGAGKGAASGAVSGGAYFFAVGLSGGPFGAMLAPVMAAVGAAGGAVTGGMVGGTMAMSDEDAKRTEAAVSGAIRELNVQGQLAGSLADALPRVTGITIAAAREGGPASSEDRPDYRTLAGPDPGLVIETSVLDLGFSSGKKMLDPMISFFLNVRLRVVDPSSGGELYAKTASYRGAPRTIGAWVKDDAVALKREFEHAFAELAVSISEELFLVHDFRLDPISPAATQCMLRPFAPVTTFMAVEPVDPMLPRIGAGPARLRFASADAIRPLLRWEAFPRDRDREYNGSGILSRIGKVSYDLRIWKGHDDHPDRMVYERTGLALPEQAMDVQDTPDMPGEQPSTHRERFVEQRLEAPLEPGTEYFWAMRARFELDGRTRVTRWSFSRIPWQSGPDPCVSIIIPADKYYRFVTPDR